MLKSRKAAFAGGAVFALVVGSGTAFAATGGTFILGKINYASSVTKLKNTGDGPALVLRSDPSYPALRVNNTTKVPRLNADLLDGNDASEFAKASGATGYIQASAVEIDEDENGFPEFLVAVAECPTGMKMTGGGSVDLTTTGFVFVNAPNDTQSWIVAAVTDNATAEDPEDLIASVVCYNPTGSIVGTLTVGPQPTSPDSVPTDLLKKLR